MELANMSRVIVEISPTARTVVTQKLIELGAVVRRFSSGHRLAHATHAPSSKSPEVVIEAVIDATATNRVMQALSELCSDDVSVSISVSNGFAPIPWNEARRSQEVVAERTQRWGDYLITI
jgi:hypothetical protein